ncbi:MFS transporter [Nocardia callitridis]|uniref:MFS transporter n=1 Tax=Nocardia callitridis TaxID=648753 RepID=A0ABP9KNG8_9NOCA
MDWLDWAIYTTFAVVFSPLFFPPGESGPALLFSLAVFAVGFVMRPVGAILFGAYADRHGRKRGLVLTIVLMATSSLVIGLTPTYENIGVLAPIVLVCCRLLQGLAAGGEFGSSAAYLVESAAPRRRAFAGSWQQVSVGAGLLLAAGMGATVTSLLPEAAVSAWGWRLAFIVAALCGFAALWVRSAAQESESFESAIQTADKVDRSARRHPVLSMFREHPRAAMRVFAINIGGTLLYYIWLTYLPVYINVTTDMPLSEALRANVITIAVFIALLPIAGLLSDRFGRKPTMLTFAVGFVLYSWPAFHFLNGEFFNFLLIECIGAVLLLGYCANAATIMSEQFPAAVRASGIGVPYALSVTLFGGTAPYILTWLNSHEFSGFIWVYCAVAAAIGACVYFTMPETKGKALD